MEQLDTLTKNLIKKYSEEINNDDYENVILDAVSIGGAKAINSLKKALIKAEIDMKPFDVAVAKIISKLLGVEA